MLIYFKLWTKVDKIVVVYEKYFLVQLIMFYLFQMVENYGNLEKYAFFHDISEIDHIDSIHSFTLKYIILYHIESAINQVITYTRRGLYIINQINFDSLINKIPCIIQLS